MTARHTIFDRDLLRRRRARAAEKFSAHSFLYDRVAEDAATRLMDIQRTFALGVDLHASTGSFARRLKTTAPGKIARLVAMDSTIGMVRAAPAPRLVADAEALPLADASCNVIVSLLGLHTVNDLPGTLVQIRRALKPDGLFIGAMLGGDTLHELRGAFAEAETVQDGGVSPRVAPFADIRDLGSLLQRAGLALPVADLDRVVVTYPTPLHLLQDLRGMGETNCLVERRRTPLRRSTLNAMCAQYSARWAGADGRIPATFDVIYLTGWAPHASQQQPLPPGSAKARLADALGAEERSANDKAPRPRNR